MSLSVGEFSSASLARPIAVEQRAVQERAGLLLAASFGAYFLFALLLQICAGAYTAEFSGYPDETAHFTTGLMLRDYIASGFPGNPVRYAENYYLHYPKVAIGHWPPLFHMIEALWLLVFPVSRASVMALMAVYCAIVATLLARWITPRYGAVAGYCTGALFVALPLVQEQTSMVMAEGLLAILSFLAASAFASYLEYPGWRPALAFAASTTLAILTKGNAWALVLVPPVAVALTRRFDLLKRVDFWAAFAIIFAACAPWQIMTAHLVQNGWVGQPGPAYFLSAVVYFAQQLWFGLNPVVLLLAMFGAVVALSAGGGVAPRDASMLSLFAGFYIFHGVTPVGLEFRQLVPGIPALLTFVPAGALAVARLFHNQDFTLLGRPAAVAGIAALFFAGETFALPVKQAYGFEQAAAYITSRTDLKDEVILVSSEAGGEGIAVTEAAMAESRPGHYILRANKLLARAEWSGQRYRTIFPSAAAVRTELNLLPASALVVDFTRGERPREHHQQVLEILASHAPEWRLAGSFGPAGAAVRPVRVYVRSGVHQLAGEHLQSILADELHRIGEQ